MRSLFPDASSAVPEPLAPGAVLLPGFALPSAPAIIDAISTIATAAPFRRMLTPGGRPMSVGMTNCGPVGWVSDRKGYRYSPIDSETGRPWPQMPSVFLDLAGRAAVEAG